MRQFFILSIVVMCSTFLHGNDFLFFQNVTQNSDLSYDAVQTICEDANGFVWFGTKKGLYHHNSIKVEKVNLLPDSSNASQSVLINKLYKDSNGVLWACSNNGLFKYNHISNSFKEIKLFNKNNKPYYNVNNIVQVDSLSYLIHVKRGIFWYYPNDSIIKAATPLINGRINFFSKDENENIYIGTRDKKIYISEDSLKNTKLFYSFCKPLLKSVCKDGDKYYLGYLGYGVDIINSEGVKIGELDTYKWEDGNSNAKFIHQIIKRKNGEIWVASHAGLVVLKNGKHTVYNSKEEIGLPHSDVYSFYIGNHGNIWVGTFSNGLAYYADYNYTFKHIPVTIQDKLTTKNVVKTFLEDDKGFIWIGSEEEGGIKRFDPERSIFINALTQSEDVKTKGISCIANVGENKIAIGKIFNKSLKIYDYKKGRVVEEIDFPDIDNLGVILIHYINNEIWAFGRFKSFVYNPVSKKIRKVYPQKETENLMHVFVDDSLKMWFCTVKGLFYKEKDSDRIKKIALKGKSFDISDVYIYTACSDIEGRIWIGTKDKGLFIYNPADNEVIEAPNYALTSDAAIYSLLKDKQGNIWYNTSKGLYQYCIKDETTRHFDRVDGIPQARTRSNSAFCSSNGYLYFGTKGGFNVIDPTIIQNNPIEPIVKIISLSVNNQSFFPAHKIEFTKLHRKVIRNLTLNYKENTIALKMVSNNYIKSEKNRFKYRLLNYEKEWTEIDQNKEIVYTQIPPGKYLLEVYASNNDGVWSSTPYQLNIVVTNSVFYRWYAILLYAIVLIVIIIVVFKEIKSKIYLKKTIAKERLKAQADELINQERVKFFTNLSHELRTPLSLIISPVRTLMGNRGNQVNSTRLLKTIDRNANRLLKIVDQSIDFRLLELGKLKAHFQKYEIIGLVNDVYLCFEEQIMQKEIEFTFTSQFDSLETVIDGDMIEKILYNLLANAIKYTPEKGKISLLIKEKVLSQDEYQKLNYTGIKFTGKSIEIKVIDSGVGISAELLPHIFKRFSKGDDSHKTSSGIGLHLCSEYSTINQGNIMVDSKKGHGSEFVLNLPFNDQITYKVGKQELLFKNEAFETDESIEAEIENNKKSFKHTVLIAEDNDELRSYLKTFLSAHFKIITAKNGKQAFEMICNLTPDILLTDVSMPVINGIELIKKIKGNTEWIPVSIIVMTAYTERKYQMESILFGADAFLVKPIDESLLLAQINNILEKRKQIALNYKTEEPIIEKESFITKVEKLIEKNLQNSDFEINDILKEMSVGRTTLARKLEAEVQLNPSGFIREVRLKSAVKLLKSNKFNIDEIAQYVGFNSTSYFIRSFKSKYGVTPREFKKS